MAQVTALGVAMLATMSTATMCGVAGQLVTVEVHVGDGLPGYTVVGLPDTTCRESRDRVRAAILSSGLTFPNRRITVNLAPSGVRKLGAGLDLAIAIGILAASDQVPEHARPSLDRMSFLGELGLDGSVRAVAGVLPMCAVLDRDAVVVPVANGLEAVIAGRHEVRPVEHLQQVLTALSGDEPWPDAPVPRPVAAGQAGLDLSQVRGQPFARLALELAAAGGHHLLLVGPPGAGKTMLAERIPTILPDLEGEGALEVSAIHSAAGEELPRQGLIRRPPFRAPHHSASLVAVVGGGSHALRPGEVSLAHRGVLFLDEMGEFPTPVLDALRQPLESGRVRLSRAHAHAEMPANFVMVAAMNPCPCGYGGSVRCDCTEPMMQRYRRRVSGPLVDRFDLRLRVSVPERRDLIDEAEGECSAAVAERVVRARQRAATRGAATNSRLPVGAIEECSQLDAAATRLLEHAIDDGRLSGRGLARVRSVALTLDDLRGGDGRIDRDLIALALALRSETDRATAPAISR